MRELVEQEEKSRTSLEGVQTTYRLLLERRKSLQLEIDALDSIARIQGTFSFRSFLPF